MSPGWESNSMFVGGRVCSTDLFHSVPFMWRKESVVFRASRADSGMWHSELHERLAISVIHNPNLIASGRLSQRIRFWPMTARPTKLRTKPKLRPIRRRLASWVGFVGCFRREGTMLRVCDEGFVQNHDLGPGQLNHPLKPNGTYLPNKPKEVEPYN